MLSRCLRVAALAASILATSAQDALPEDISASLTGGTGLQVSFSDNAVEGFRSGTTFSKADVSSEPTFALGDADGISTTTLYTILMIDATSPTSRTLHYARANFKPTGDKVNIGTDDAPILDYIAPGEAGETGDERTYVFLLYINPQRLRIEQLKMPGQGESFDKDAFEGDNGLRPAVAGMGMKVLLGGGGDAEGEGPSSTALESSPSATETVVASSTTAAVRSSTAAVEDSSSAPATSVVATSTPVASRVESASEAPQEETSTSRAASATPSEAPQDDISSATPPAQTTGLVAASSAAPPTPTSLLTSVQPGATEPSTTPEVPAEQTGSGAVSLGLGKARCVGVSAMAVLAALLV